MLKKLLSIGLVCAMLMTMGITCFAAEASSYKNIPNDEVFELDPSSLGHGEVEVPITNPRINRGINVGEHSEWVGDKDKGGEWEWGIIKKSKLVYSVFSYLCCSGYESKTLVKGGTFSKWVNSGWVAVGEQASVADVADDVTGGNKAAYDYRL
ncbi:hypothetical protein EDD70_2807 [Hydrogenoanaerobacterium saccharovorans]|uniref:Bacteriocin (Lactococcin_972) n=2 Tax=Hydrogenoanaerobacterium saccharovorans TaxID=474960 RepID=A0A1H8EA72_9FIRM|nr:hypothetical protein EDD70_2807 [Hydrogenoanaerobacterium saccharovorans]SEN16290.1 hypothetical protein SAMN05216180_2940 [Hydrogenoanaerobacterium saccharovorans]